MRVVAQCCALAMLVGLGCPILQAQANPSIDVPTTPPRIRGGFDNDISFPDTKGPLGQKDGPALTELIGHLTAVGASPWTGMQATGQITYGTEDATAYSATLSILGGTGFRLDAQSSKGQMSIRIVDEHGSIQEADGRKHPLPADTAATGIFQFVQPRLPNFPDATESLLDRGVKSVDGVPLHKVTVESAGENLNPAVPANVATDFYFDPTSHFLVKSANSIRIDGAGNNNFLRVITYADYRKVGNSMVPFSYTQTLDGRKQWTLQITEVQLNPTLNSTFFEF
ncbi:MAG: hypothetical protein M3Y72_22395 [Acidobacteriota bacterium]|nr:hypothetical protein [Acidobacteriota bacterium]